MIAKEFIILARLAKELGVESTATLDDRIVLQKKIYLLQACGIDIGHIFGWDQYGPYSKSLAQNAVLYEEHKEEIDRAVDGLELTEDGEKIISQTRQLVDLPKEGSIEPSEWLELLSSLHYLALFYFKTVFLKNEPKKVEKVNKELFEKKPHLKEQHEAFIEQAWQRLWEFLSQPTATIH